MCVRYDRRARRGRAAARARVEGARRRAQLLDELEALFGRDGVRLAYGLPAGSTSAASA